MNNTDETSKRYRRVGYRFVAFTLPVYFCFFVIIYLSREVGVAEFDNSIFLISLFHMAAAEALCLAIVNLKSTYTKENVVLQLWLMIGNNIPFFCFWVYHLDEMRTIIYVLIHTNTITLFTVASFRSAFIHNLFLCPFILAAAYMGSPETGVIEAIGSDLIHIWAYFILAVWMSFLSGQFTKQRNQLATAVSNLNEIKEELTEESKAKSEFLAKMSHEIRTPMNGVLGLLQLLRDDSKDNREQQYVSTAYNSAQALLTVINDILDFSKIEAGKLNLEKIDFDIKQLFTECIAIMNVVSDEKDIALNLHVENDMPQFVNGDPTRIRQILLNLLGNAIKFTDKGSVTLDARVENSSDGSASTQTLSIRIIDTGIGINQEVQSRLFTSFQQADSSTSRRFGGTGLGLAISKQFVDLMGGDIGIISEEGKGSIFWFTMVVGDSQSNNVSSTIKSSSHLLGDALHQVRVLVADDNPVNLMVICGMLDKLGVNVASFDNGSDLIDRYQSKPDVVDIILMDCEMPVLDGYQTTRKIRQFEDSQGLTPTPIIALTAHVVPEYLEKCLASGMNDYVIKPLDLERLGQSLLQWYQTKEEPQEVDAMIIENTSSGNRPDDQSLDDLH